MKKVISALTAATMVASMSASVMSAFALYSESDIGYYLKVNPDSYFTVASKSANGEAQSMAYNEQTANFTVSEDGKTITFASAADAAGVKFGVDAYIVADTAAPSVQICGGMVKSSSKSISFEISGPIFGDGVAAEGAPAKEYTTTSGTFTTDMFAHTFGTIAKIGKKFQINTANMSYGDSSSWESWGYDGPNAFLWIWQYNAGANPETAEFIDEKSDTLPITEFTVIMGDDITDGTYTIDFEEKYLNKADASKDPVDTFASFINVDGKQNVIPASLEGITIIVGDASADTKPSDEPTETETEAQPTETEAQPTETDPTEPAPAPGGEIDGYTWKIDDVVYDPEAAGGDPDLDYFELPIKIYNDPGTNGFEFTILIDGKKLDDPACPFEYLQFDVGDAYQVGTKQQVFGTVAGTMVGDANNYAEDGSSAFIWYLGPKEGVEYVPGTVYAVTYDENENFIFGDEDKNQLFPTGAAGSITIAGGEVQQPSTDAEEPSTDKEEPSTDKEEPSTDNEEPSTDKEEPSTDKEEPSTDKEEPSQGGDVDLSNPLYGDVNKNGKVELVDIVMLNRFLTKYDNQTLDDYQIEVANCADNTTPGKSTAKDLNGSDSVEILKYLIGLVDSLDPKV